ncbi:ATPase domain-containing protein [Sulfuriferula sp. GW1]|uniref:ATPase domain-containing protein n=1 Tax=Sulfuriferula sp. GW1 TaxID=3345111 RepID=UPI0039B09683
MSKSANLPLPGESEQLSLGVDGLDDILRGGLTADRLYLIEGMPGSGKTTIGLQFLLEGARRGEPTLYITLSETEAELQAVAKSHGWSLENIHVHEVIASEDFLDPAEQHTLFHPSEVELGDTTQNISSIVEAVKPKRVVIDSLSELRLLSSNPLRYRRQILAYKQFFARRACTVLMLDDRPDTFDMQIRSIAHGVISLDQTDSDYGAGRRRLRIIKFRGMNFREGFHDYKIRRGGVAVFPRLIAAETRTLADRLPVSSGIAALDMQLGGGLEEGTSTIIGGPPGTGKSTLAAQFAMAAINRGDKAALFIFEESTNILLNRTAEVGIDLRDAHDKRSVMIYQIDPAEMSPGEFAQQVCASVEENNAKLVVIDSLNGYLNAMPDERFLSLHMHELLAYLGQRGVTTILVGVHQGMIGNTMSTAVEASYLADNVLLLRHFEYNGEVRQAVSVFKKRASVHERTIREFSISGKGIYVGEVLHQFHGVLTGIPTFVGSSLNDSE